MSLFKVKFNDQVAAILKVLSYLLPSRVLNHQERRKLKKSSVQRRCADKVDLREFLNLREFPDNGRSKDYVVS